MRIATLLTVCVLLGGYALAADTLTLKDGQVVTGKILDETETDVRIATDEETMRIPRWAIEKIERDGNEGATGQLTGQTADPPARVRREGVGERARPGAAPTAALLAWIDVCIEHLASGDRAVRGSAGAALRSTGAAAKPALEQAASSDNELVAQRARVLLGRPATPTFQEDGVGPLALALDLTKEQKPKVATIFEELRAEQREVIAKLGKGEADGNAIKDELAAVRARSDAKLAEVLTEEQMTRYREMKSGR